MPKKIYPKCIFPLLFLVLASCGDDNIFSEMDKTEEIVEGGDPALNNAANSIANGDFAQAEKDLQSLLESDPNNIQARSMLANVFLKKTGIDSLEFSKDVEEATDISGAVSVPAMIKSLPPATQENLDSLATSVDTFNLIPEEELSPTQSFQKAMAEFSYAMVLTKKSATDESGNYNKEKSESLTTGEADIIINNMDAAASSVRNAGGNENVKSSQKIAKTTEQIKNTAGTTSADKLKAFLETEDSK